MGPNTIILDTQHLLPKLQHMVLHSDHESYAADGPNFLVDLVQEVVERLRDRRTAERLLHELVDEIAVGACPSGGDFVPPEFGPTVLELGKCLLEQLDAIGAYNLQHILPYHFHVFPKPEDNPDVTLVRTQELPR